MNRNDEMMMVLQEKTVTIFKYLIKIGANPRDAEDIVQEALYKLFLYIDSVDPDKAYSWLFRVAVNQYYDLCRKQKREVSFSFENMEFVDELFLPEEYIEQMEMEKEIQHLLDQLSPLHKQLILLKYVLGYSYEEIAEMLDLNPGTLKTYLYRARQSFKDLYRKEKEKHE
ncbi:RNA polymerase sigma factor [Mesobacillus maritimus]|uniref:RNA polymerase sigma factor n=1 Tax=Mesobacillus maritimus TaxID=1643336 RepID=UPI0020423A71|nr:RNA polymerase sigma factor [Mesobacillus maritimus]MCM3585804.1 RNA polymerase sigma factor [Mesobacillus maritimus]MCM3670564.1 RNA polymerase sigma factor [Mesobacillus maritimus]